MISGPAGTDWTAGTCTGGIWYWWYVVLVVWRSASSCFVGVLGCISIHLNSYPPSREVVDVVSVVEVRQGRYAMSRSFRDYVPPRNIPHRCRM